MKKILLLSVGLALATSSAQPVVKETLEKARTITGIVGAIATPVVDIASNSMVKTATRSMQDAFVSGNRLRIENEGLNLINTGVKSGLLAASPTPLIIASNFMSAALEKDDVLAVRLMEYFMSALNVKTPPSRELERRLRNMNNLATARAANEANLAYLTEKENTFKSCSGDQAKAMGLELAAALVTEIANLGLYKGLEAKFPGNDQRIKRRMIRTLATGLLVGLLSWAKQEAAQSVAPQIAHIYKPVREAIFALIGKAITETGGEIVASQIDEITQIIEEAQNLEVATPVVPQPQA